MKTTQNVPHSDSLYNGVTGGFFATVSYLVGGFDNLMIAFGIFVALDYFTGALAGWYTAKLSSDRAFRGLAKKAGMMCFAIVATQLDYTFGSGDGFLRGAVLMILIGTEGISIMENLARMGVKIPRVLYDRLEQLQNGDTIGGVTDQVNEKKEEKKDG
jgi:toxin secretion/phage lysis holin